MPDIRTQQPSPGRFGFLRVPLFRLLAINLAAGTAVAALSSAACWRSIRRICAT